MWQVHDDGGEDVAKGCTIGSVRQMYAHADGRISGTIQLCSERGQTPAKRHDRPEGGQVGEHGIMPATCDVARLKAVRELQPREDDVQDVPRKGRHLASRCRSRLMCCVVRDRGKLRNLRVVPMRELFHPASDGDFLEFSKVYSSTGSMARQN